MEVYVADYAQVLTTTDTESSAISLGSGILESHLAACIQINGPVKSLYWWQGSIEDAQEWQLFIKTTTERLPALEAHIKANHSYDTPEIIVTPITGGSAEYLGWVRSETEQAGAS